MLTSKGSMGILSGKYLGVLRPVFGSNFDEYSCLELGLKAFFDREKSSV